MGEPTPSLASHRLEQLFGVERTGWAGRPFDDLAIVPDSLIALAGGTWNHSGREIVLLKSNPTGASVVVLTSDELNDPFPIVEGALPGSGLSAEARIDGWFEVIDATSGAEVDMRISLPVNEWGRALLDQHEIPSEWPFLVRTGESLYLAADACENSVAFPLRRMAGSPSLMRFLPQSPQTEFFYRVYLPVMQWLIGMTESANGLPSADADSEHH